VQSLTLQSYNQKSGKEKTILDKRLKKEEIGEPVHVGKED